MVASRREMYMYSKKKNPPFFIRGVRSRGTVSIIITRSETEERLASLSARFESAPQSGRNPDDDGNPPPERALVSLTESGRERGGSAARGSDCRGLKGPFIASFGSTTHEHEEETNGKQSLCTKAQQP